jgi:glycosyltransferase involved in cell wall biosynthesis
VAASAPGKAARATAHGVKTLRVNQVMETLSYGDAVSNITRDSARLLEGMGYKTRIYAQNTDPRVAHQAAPLRDLESTSSTPVIIHYWGYSGIEDFIETYRGPRAVHFHNITPAKYFDPESPSFELTNRGYAQLRRIAGLFDLVLAPSVFDLVEFSEHLLRPRPTLCVPPLIEPEIIRKRPVDRGRLAELASLTGDKFVFVGRIAPNKRQDLLMYAFDEYYRNIRRDAHLFLVGSYGQGDPYHAALERLRADLPSGERITLTGHVSDEQLAAYYEAGEVFVCASEHEGFGVPLVEAMAYGMPVIAFNSSAVPEAMGDAGVLVNRWDSPRVAELMNLAAHDKQFRTEIIQRQTAGLSRFSKAAVEQALRSTVEFLSEGREAPGLVWRGPGSGDPRA